MAEKIKIDTLVQKALDQQIFSGAQVLVGRGKESLFVECYGKVSCEASSATVTSKTLFDVASLTKPIVTTTLALLAIKRSQFNLDTPINKLLSGWQRPEPMTLKHLLAHNSGLKDWLPLYETSLGQNFTPQETKQIYLKQIQESPLVRGVGEKRIYSDLGFMLLGWILEEQFGKSLDELFKHEIAQPLGLTSSYFNPLQKNILPQNIAATENCPWRGKILQGEVHDDNAAMLGGVAGHAGLFSTAEDIEKFIHWIWQNWQDLSLQTFIGSQVFPKLGWDTVSKPKSQAGKYFSDQAIGHLGFTGCSLWLDPQDQKYIILLNNSVHPVRHKEAIQDFRPKLHNLLSEELGLV